MEKKRVINKSQGLFVLAAILTCIPGISLAVSESDFAYKADLDTKKTTPYYELVIPEIVYKQISRDDLGDIRVLNAAGDVVPHGIRDIAVEQMNKQYTESVAYFPLYESSPSMPGGLHLKIQRSSSGEVIDIKSSDAERNASDKLTGYLLDLRKWNQSIDAIKIDWDVEKDSSFIRKLEISVSDDLSKWKLVSSDKTLVNLSYQKHSLIENTLELPVAKAKYLRITYADGKPGLELTGIKVSNTKSSQNTKQNWKGVTVKKTSNDVSSKEGEYFFKHELKTAINKIRIKLPENNTVVNASVMSKTSQDKTWRLRGSSMLYRLSVDGVEIQHTDVIIPRSTDTDWKIKVDQQGGGLGAGLPEIELAWQPQQLIFVARGNAPYKLVWGSARVSPVTLNADQIMVGVNKSNRTSMLSNAVWLANTVSPVNLNSLEAEKTPVNWRQILLWSVLIVAAILLVWMAVRLMGKMAE